VQQVTTQQERGEAFRALHSGEAFVIPNPWDAGSAKVLAALGFEALATTSAGFAFTLGRRDGDVSLDEVIDHTRELAEATPLPVSVDLENGYGPAPEQADLAITRAAEAGAVGGSIEDWDGEQRRIYDLSHAADRVAAAVEAAQRLDVPFTLTARAENFFRRNPDMEDTIARLQAYERAGANVLYAPALISPDQVRAVREATSRPLNVLGLPGMSFREIVDAGATRISVGSQLTWVAVGAFAKAAERLRAGDLSALPADVRIKEWLGA
jgi:2-methylisocitrate lyase-like PEP mutase family enzyme